MAIAALEQRGLIQKQVTGSEVLYSAGSVPPETKQMLADPLQLYNEHPVTLIKIVYARSDGRLFRASSAF